MAHLSPWEILAILGIFVVLPAAVFGATIWRLVRTALELKQLTELGAAGRIETDAIVLDKEERLDRIRGAGTRRYLVRYEYRDGRGDPHRRRAEVPEATFRAAVPGGSLLVAYSAQRPQVSAPVAAIEEAAARFRSRQRARADPGDPGA